MERRGPAAAARRAVPVLPRARRSVHKDGYLEVDKAYYSAPPEYVGHRLWVRWDGRLVRIFNHRWEQLVVHAKTEPGRFRTAPEHIPKEKYLPWIAARTPCYGRWPRSARTAGMGGSDHPSPRRGGRAGSGGAEARGKT